MCSLVVYIYIYKLMLCFGYVGCGVIPHFSFSPLLHSPPFFSSFYIQNMKCNKNKKFHLVSRCVIL